MKKIITLIFTLLLCSIPSIAAEAYTPYSVPNVHIKDRTKLVSDPDSLLSPTARAEADATLTALMDSTGVEVAIVVLPSIGDADIFDFTHELARHWGVGKKDKSNGLIVLFDMGGHKVRIHTGTGMEGVFPDALCNRIIDQVIIPRLRTGDLDDAVVDVAHSLYSISTDPQARAEISSDMPNNAPSADFRELGRLFLLLATLIAAGTYLWLIVTALRLRRRDDFQKALAYRRQIPLSWILSVLSLGMALPVGLLIWWLARYYRNHKRKCDVCGTLMHKLPEDEDNHYLTPAQDLEENLKSVDYDVWLCPRCGSTEIFPFMQTSPYLPCPHCGARAYTLLYDRVEQQPTPTRAGRGIKVYSCKNCGYRHDTPYTIAKTAPMPIIIGGGGPRGGGGGGFSGGSFGGGSFGGGGASGSW